LITAVRQVVPSAVGLTHADSVIRVVRSSEAASGTVTQSLTPSKVSAAPKRPVAARAAPLIVPVLPVPERSVTPAPLASSNP
jgi:hypothetical protein